jgi:hypothetical protein
LCYNFEKFSKITRFERERLIEKMHLIGKKVYPALPRNVRIRAEKMPPACETEPISNEMYSTTIDYLELSNTSSSSSSFATVVSCSRIILNPNSSSTTSMHDAPTPMMIEETISNQEEAAAAVQQQDNYLIRDPKEHNYDLNIIMTDGVDRQFIRNIWQIPITEWDSTLLNYWLCRLDPDERENPQLVEITHYRRYGNYRLYQFCCIFSTATAIPNSNVVGSSSSNSCPVQRSAPIWVHYGALKRSFIYHEQILCGKKYQWNWRIMQRVDDGDYDYQTTKKTTEEWLDEMENPTTNTTSEYKIHTMDEAIKMTKLFYAYM